MTLRSSILALSAAGLLLCAACSSTTTTTTDTGTSSSSADMTSSASTASIPAQTQSVSIQNFAFGVKTLTVKQGTTVTWTNSDSASHTVTGDTSTELASSTLAPGQTYSHTFDTAGTFAYHCSIHPSMKAVVVVLP